MCKIIETCYKKCYISVRSISTTTLLFLRPDTLWAISSPNYPENYSNNEHASILIFSPSGSDVELNFLDLELAASCLRFNYGETYYTLPYMIKLLII